MNQSFEKYIGDLQQLYHKPVHFDWLENKVTILHNRFRGRAFERLSSQSGERLLTLCYTLPLLLFSMNATRSVNAASAVFGVAYLLSSGENRVAPQTRVNILHSIALTLLANGMLICLGSLKQ